MNLQRPTEEPAVPERLQAAADLFEARQSGAVEPEGSWIDRVWLPSERERRSCCEGLEPDRLKDPQKLKSHCRTLLHVANYCGVESRPLRAELKRRREAREEAEEGSPGLHSRFRRAWPTPRIAPGEPPSTEATALHAKLVRLLAEQRAELRGLAKRAAELFGELDRRLEDERQPIEVALAETGATDLVETLKALLDDIQHLIITRDTIRRVL